MPEKLLKEEHRQTLDSLVKEMSDAGESPTAIQSVVDDFKQKYEAEPTFWEKHPNLAGAARGVTSALPAIGGMAGGLVAAPGLVTTPVGVGLGAGIGRGAQDLIEEATGLQKPTTPTSKALRIGGDVAVGAGTQAIIPGLLEAAEAPFRTAEEMSNLLPPGIKRFAVPARRALEQLKPPPRAPEPNLTRPPEPPPTSPAPPATPVRTGTSMVPAAVGRNPAEGRAAAEMALPGAQAAMESQANAARPTFEAMRAQGAFSGRTPMGGPAVTGGPTRPPIKPTGDLMDQFQAHASKAPGPYKLEGVEGLTFERDPITGSDLSRPDVVMPENALEAEMVKNRMAAAERSMPIRNAKIPAEGSTKFSTADIPELEDYLKTHPEGNLEDATAFLQSKRLERQPLHIEDYYIQQMLKNLKP